MSITKTSNVLMKDFIGKSSNLSRVEFWAGTAIFIFATFFLTANAVKNDIYVVWTPNRSLLEEARIPFNYYEFYFFPQLARYVAFYLSFLLLSFRVAPDLVKGQKLIQNILLVVLTYLVIAAVLGITDTYLKNYVFVKFDTEQHAYNALFQSAFVHAAWVVLLFALYTLIKVLAVYLITNSETIQSRYQMVTEEGIVAFVLWMIVVFLLIVMNADDLLIWTWATTVPFAIIIYWLSFDAYIPRSRTKKKPLLSYYGRIMWIVVAAFVLMILAGGVIDSNTLIPVSFFNAAFQLVITAPVTWFLYKRRQQGNEEMINLRTALGQSAANLDFLRSQINPHFLFNALNTIYGTALQEGAVRTSEGVERLGEMMRFMLQENMQEKIALSREIDYLNNYITLQRLRTDTSPEVRIETAIDESVNTLQISPMLLIPLVENAFKHGISLREPSHIRISLLIQGSKIFFDVNNSVHIKPDTDPEKNKSGIGLANVRQRLQLLYPNKHELVIRETSREFYAHLTIVLE